MNFFLKHLYFQAIRSSLNQYFMNYFIIQAIFPLYLLYLITFTFFLYFRFIIRYQSGIQVQQPQYQGSYQLFFGFSFYMEFFPPIICLNKLLKRFFEYFNSILRLFDAQHELNIINLKTLNFLNCIYFSLNMVSFKIIRITFKDKKMIKDKSQPKNYKDLVKENMRLNAELRKIGSQLNGNDYTSKKITESTARTKSIQLRNKPIKQLQKIKEQQLMNKKNLFSLKSKQNLHKNSIQGQSKQYENQSKDTPRSKKSNFKLSLQLEKIKNIQKSEVFFKDNLKKNTQQKRVSIIRKNSQINFLDLQKTEQDERWNLHKMNSRFNEKLELKMENIQKIKEDNQQLLSWTRENIIGFNTSYISAVGLPIETVYIDHTATNRPFKLVEVLVQHAKLFAANPHTEFSRYGKFSTQLMHYARDSLLKSFSAPQNQYVVLPTGGGSTGAIEKALHFLQTMSESNADWKNPTIFLTPYEHHSNILPWVEFYEKNEVLAHNKIGTLDMERIIKQLSECSSNHIIVTVSAASNVTSKLTHLKELNDVIKYVRQTTNKSIVFCVDCAAFCCHHDLNLSIYDQIDFAFLSPHKNLGGAQSCGILLGRKSLMKSARPTFPGGGTVKFVKGYSKDDVMYEVDVFSKQIAGTPPYLGFYRAALSFQLLKNVIGYNFIHERQRRNTQLFFQKINASNAIMKAEGIDTFINLYGERDLGQRANIMTFNFVYEDFKYIQHSFAALVLTDLFGLQVRSGCFCAGPYGILLLQVNQENMQKIKDEVEAGININKPGYLRLDLTFYLEDYEVEYIAKSIALVARYWRNLQKLYTVCNDGEVILLPIFNKYQKTDLYSLHEAQGAYQKLKEENATHMNKLENRRKTLERQLKVGQSISKNPLQFLKRVKNQQTPSTSHD